MSEAEQVERIVKEGIIVDVDGEKYSCENLKKVRDIIPPPKGILLNTLNGLCDYLDTNIDNLSKKEVFILVENFHSVVLLCKLDQDSNTRYCYVSVQLDAEGKKFPFGRFLDSEEFMIRLQSMFRENEDLKILRSFVSRLSVNESIKTMDDGVRQDVIIHKGVSGALKESQAAPAILNLVPIRTFVEVDQPASRFLFRMQAEPRSIPRCALIEADGGLWKNTAMNNIKSWLQKNLENMTIIA